MERKKVKRKSFADWVYECLRRVPRGRVISHQDLAKAVGSPGAARAVGNALKANPDVPGTPCHRVVCSDGTIGGYQKGLNKKVALLRADGVKVEHKKNINFYKIKIEL